MSVPKLFQWYTGESMLLRRIINGIFLNRWNPFERKLRRTYCKYFNHAMDTTWTAGGGQYGRGEILHGENANGTLRMIPHIIALCVKGLLIIVGIGDVVFCGCLIAMVFSRK